MQAAQVGFADVDVLRRRVCVQLLVPLLQEVLFDSLQRVVLSVLSTT